MIHTNRYAKAASENKPAFIHGISRHEAKTSRAPGSTKKLDFFPISNKPRMYIYDTPGVSFLKDNMECDRGMRLAALGVFDDKVVGNMDLADYILFRLNKMRNFEYVHHLELDQPTNDVCHLSSMLAERMGSFQNYENPDTHAGAMYFIESFRSGVLGQICLDDIPTDQDLDTLRNLLREAEPPGPWGPANYGSDHTFASRHLLRAKDDAYMGVEGKIKMDEQNLSNLNQIRNQNQLF